MSRQAEQADNPISSRPDRRPMFGGFTRRHGWYLLAASLALHLIVLWAMPGPGGNFSATMRELLIVLSRPEAPAPAPVVIEVPDEPSPTPDVKKSPPAFSRSAAVTPAPRGETADDTGAESVSTGPEVNVAGMEALDARLDDSPAVQGIDGINKPDVPVTVPAAPVAPPPGQDVPEPQPEETAGAAVDGKAALVAYAAGIKQEILSRKYYPARSERLGQRGTARVGFTINAAGALESVYLRQSAGYDALDEAALAAVRLAAPFAPIPAVTGKTSLSLSISLKFSLE